MVNETKMPKPQEYTDTFILTKQLASDVFKIYQIRSKDPVFTTYKIL